MFANRMAAEVYYRKEALSFYQPRRMQQTTPKPNHSWLAAVLGDIQFWIPFGILLLGLVLLKSME